PLLQPPQRRIQRPLPHLQHLLRHLLDALRNPEPVHRPQRQRLQDQQFQHPLAPGDRFCAACGAALSIASAIAATPTGAPASPAGTLAGAKYSIVGYEMQAAVVSLAAGQTVMAEPGTLLYMRGAVEMNTGMTGGLMSGFKRALAG